MKKCYKCLDSNVIVHHNPNGGGRIYPCGCQTRRSTPAEAQRRLNEKRKKLGIKP